MRSKKPTTWLARAAQHWADCKKIHNANSLMHRATTFWSLVTSMDPANYSTDLSMSFYATTVVMPHPQGSGGSKGTHPVSLRSCLVY